ncbi:MAG: GIY-YIG nuclease family protein [Microbispora sp.]|nr:GIY-YIG nuclease family protein [Microbispora sp.]
MTPPDYTASLQHVDLLAAKIANLTLAQIDTEEQVIHRIASDYRAGRIDIEQVLEHYLWLKERAASGFMFRWNRHMPDNASAKRIRHTVHTRRRHTPGPDGIWRGAYPFGDTERYPRTPTPVVYVLFDAANEPCYVGSTADFRGRAKAHHKEGKPFVRWMAYPCADREAAYRLEERLQREHLPYLNRKVGR